MGFLNLFAVFSDVSVFGDTNLELPSFRSNRSVVEIHVEISSRDYENGEISIKLPLHARYQVNYHSISGLFLININKVGSLLLSIISSLWTTADTLEWSLESQTCSCARVMYKTSEMNREGVWCCQMADRRLKPGLFSGISLLESGVIQSMFPP